MERALRAPHLDSSFVTEGWPTVQSPAAVSVARSVVDLRLSWPHGYKFVEDQFSAPTPEGPAFNLRDLPPDLEWRFGQRFVLIFRPDASVFSGVMPNLRQSSKPQTLGESAHLVSFWLPQLGAGVIRDHLPDGVSVEQLDGQVVATLTKRGLRFRFADQDAEGLNLVEIELFQPQVGTDAVIERYRYSDFRNVAGFAVQIPFVRENWLRRTTYDVRTRKTEEANEISLHSVTRLISITATKPLGLADFDPASVQQSPATSSKATASTVPSSGAAGATPGLPQDATPRAPQNTPGGSNPSGQVSFWSDPTAVTVTALGALLIIGGVTWKLARRGG